MDIVLRSMSVKTQSYGNRRAGWVKMLLFGAVMFAFSLHGQEKDKLSNEELAKINRALDNPLANYWSLVFQENYAINQGNAVDGNVTSNTFFSSRHYLYPLVVTKCLRLARYSQLLRSPIFQPILPVLKKSRVLGIFKWPHLSVQVILRVGFGV